ncbi:MAG: hypothetical protein ABIQ02_07630 [Saprospiraceae bacterium]
MLRKTSLLLFTMNFLFHPFLNAASVINTEDRPTSLIEMNEMIPDHHATHAELKILKRNEKRLNRFESLVQRMHKVYAEKKSGHAGLFTDPVNKWLWLWLITWGIGILVLVVSSGGVASPAIGIIWLLAFAIGSVALIIWLVKKFG